MAATKTFEDILSVSDLTGMIAPLLRERGAAKAFLGGEYVRADRNGDIRSWDEIGLLVVADTLPDEHSDRYEQFRSAVQAAREAGVYLRLNAYTFKEAERAGGIDRTVALAFDDWTQIL